jgi:excisionase family DNA binding protein
MSSHSRFELVPAPSASVEYLSPNDAAARLGIDVSTLYKHYGAAIRRGDIKTVKIGKARRILWSSLIAYIEAETRRKVA